MDKKVQRNFLWIALLVLGTIWILARHNQTAPYQTTSGLIFGTVYNITYQYDGNLKDEIEAELKRFDGSLSPFNDTATITRINRNEDIVADTFFTNVFHRSMEISRETNGAFDITVAPLANAWGFGFKKGAFPDSVMIDSLLGITGYAKVALTEEGKVKKQDPRIMLSCSAVAKGYAVDVIAQFLQKKGIHNFMVDIGGEVVVRGENPKKSLWRIGINKPVDDSLAVNQELQTVLEVTNVGIATSGNYRNYYYKDGKKYAHTIDPRTGYPIQHNILSATVIAKDCMSADAYATAFMVMGLKEAERFADAHPDIDACFIYTNDKGEFQTFFTKGMEKYMGGK
nr:FAD:protein FMN transferase [uncultured Bacteroides sp.]